MNQQDLEYLREMAIKSEKEDFSGQDLQNISKALRANVDATDTTEALDLTARIIDEQSQYRNILGEKRNIDREKLHDLAKEVIYYGDLLGAEDAIHKIDGFDFAMEVEKENVTDKNLQRERYEDGHGFLYESILFSCSPNTINAILDKGGRFKNCDEPSDQLFEQLLYRVTQHYKLYVKDRGEKSVKHDLENMAILLDRGLVEASDNIDMLLSNPVLFEKYPETMKKFFDDSKELQEHMKNIKQRKENKEQNKDYLREKLAAVRKAVYQNKRLRRGNGETRFIISRGYNIGDTGNSNTGEINEFHHNVATVQKNAVKELMQKHRDEKRDR